jgi:hypothetical protein
MLSRVYKCSSYFYRLGTLFLLFSEPTLSMPATLLNRQGVILQKPLKESNHVYG